MDAWSIISFIFLAFIIMSCCGYCCRRSQRGTVLAIAYLGRSEWPLEEMASLLVIGICTSLLVFIVTALVSCVFQMKRMHEYTGQKERYAIPPVLVTSTTHTAPSGYTTQMPGYQTNVYMPSASQPPYPTQLGVQQMPMPMPGAQPSQLGVQAHMAPYPPMPMPSANMNPPSYDMVVAGNSSGQPNTGLYEKQAPYNPTYPSQ